MDWMLMGLLLAATAAMIGLMRTRLTGIYRPTTVVRAELLEWYDAGRGSMACFDAQGGTLRLWVNGCSCAAWKRGQRGMLEYRKGYLVKFEGAQEAAANRPCAPKTPADAPEKAKKCLTS